MNRAYRNVHSVSDYFYSMNATKTPDELKALQSNLDVLEEHCISIESVVCHVRANLLFNGGWYEFCRNHSIKQTKHNGAGGFLWKNENDAAE